MPRPPKCRRVEFVPTVTHFVPAGVGSEATQTFVLSVEELEAIRLRDLEGLDQEDCAWRMEVSRPTFARILENARRKVASALVDGASISIQGGNFKLATSGYRKHLRPRHHEVKGHDHQEKAEKS